MTLTIVLAFALVAITFVFHYRVLLHLSKFTQKRSSRTSAQVLVIVLALFLAHLAEIGLYAVAYAVSVNTWGLGAFQGSLVTDSMSFIYYSGVIYTTLGLGDIQPIGHIRFLTATEALNGFLLITWSASYTFLAMSRIWPWAEENPHASADK